jgi:histone H3/H4
MPPPYRQPSQSIGATAATKRPFKPPAISKGAATSSSSGNAPARPAPAAQKQTARALSATRPQAWNTNTASGFQSAGAQFNQDDLEAMIISDEDDDEDNDDFSAAPTRKAPLPTTTHDQPPAPKRQKTAPPPRLPSLSPMSSALQSAPPPPQHPATTIGTKKDDIPLLPSTLITRLLHESFEDKNTKIGKEANALTARYLDLFVREAVARATEVARERKEIREAGGDKEEEGVWLDVQDLEEVAPGLVMDF